ncbi:impB/mucB/samB family protein [Methyloversatilis sp. RAC08]|uniref:Y-family DNA polymerase n=1 Tax=Methyloversatilis sp. RAC08 TaxID=1842540 RepID=UPI00083E1826|nr:DNA polymerase IV [Methyloversatilis sp. RAC08]AOF81654.1 impB/mucB/samB family protein [Methyloversatilis sp. RAC08]
MTRRWIAHLDMDAFFASVELLRYPELRGLPMVVGGGARHQPERLPDGTRRFARLRDYAGRGVATTATYEARAFGVHSGIGLMKAAALAPDTVLLPVDFDAYRHYSRLFKATVSEHAPLIEDRGIDEIYMDLTDLPGAQDAIGEDMHGGVRAIALRIQQAVLAATGLSCSIGITPNKLLSKLASDLHKPQGITLLTEADVPSVIWPLPARRINGIGPKASAKLEALGIGSIAELAAAEPLWLIEQFGQSYGRWLTAAAHGRDDRPLVTEREAKSLSRETTFERDLHARHDRAELGEIFTGLCERLAEDLQRKGYVAKSIGAKMRLDDFSILTRELTLPVYICDAPAIRHHAGLCVKRMPLDRRFRLLGVRAGHLMRADALPPPGAAPDKKEGQLALPF